MADKVYLDDQGNPIPGAKMYLDDSGNPIKGKVPPPRAPSLFDRATSGVVSPGAIANAMTGSPTGFTSERDAPPYEGETPLHARWRAGIAGAGQSAAEVLSSFSSPASIATMGLGALGKVPGAIGTVAKGLNVVAGTGFAGQGVSNMGGARPGESAPDVVQRNLMAPAQVLGGVASALEPVPAARGPLSDLPSAVASGAGKVASGAGKVASAVSAGNAARNAAIKAQNIGSATQDLVKSIPPTKSTPYDPAKDIPRARPYLEAEHEANPVTDKSGVSDIRDNADSGIGKIEDHMASYIQAYPNDTVPSVLGDVQTELAKNARGAAFVKDGLKELDDFNLGQPKTLIEANRIRQQLNQENKGVLLKSRYDVGTARAVDPGFAAREVAAEGLRNGIADQLENVRNIPGIRELRRDEGSLIRIRNAAQNQIYNGDRPVGGSGKGGVVREAGKNLIEATGTGIGAKVANVPGAIVGSQIGKAVARTLGTGNLTRNQLASRSFSKSVAGRPVFPALPPPPPGVTPAAAPVVPAPQPGVNPNLGMFQGPAVPPPTPPAAIPPAGRFP